jgi:ribose/xylose/arabinose/galactoside ABC-type transport system permease subunit
MFAGILLGGFFGLLNGFFIGFMNIPPFITTLGTMNIARGFALLISRGMIISLDRDPVPDPENLALFFSLGGGSIFGIPSLAIVFVILSLITYVFYHRSLIGFRIRAVGGNKDAARASGIGVRTITMITYIILGFLCGLTGLLNFSFMHTVQGTMGIAMELQVIAAAIIGGANPTGGGGTVIGTVIGVLIMGVLRNGLILLGVNAHLQTVLVGFLIIGVVTYDMNRGRNGKY